MKSKNLFFILILILTFGSMVFPQNDNNSVSDKPLWLRLDNAVRLIETGESGDAVYHLRKVLEDYPGNPEAEMWLGIIFEKENEYELAVRHLDRSLEKRKQFLILENQFRVLYLLAEIHEKSGNMKDFEISLLKIIELAEERDKSEKMTAPMLSVLRERGYDKFVELYRPEGIISVKAESILGKYYYEINELEKAEEHLMMAVGYVLTNAASDLKRQFPDFQYIAEDDTDRSLNNLLDRINNNKRLKEYLDENDYFENMFFLGLALKKTGNTKSGNYILNKLYLRPESGKWGILAGSQSE